MAQSTEQLRILHVSPYGGHAWAYGGIPRICAALASEQARCGHEVTLCSTDAFDAEGRLAQSQREEISAWAEERSVQVELFPNVSNTLAFRYQFFCPLGMRRFLSRSARHFDIAHVHAHHNLPSVFAAEALKRAGVPFLLAPNGTAPRIEQRQLLKWLFDSTLGRRVLPNASGVIAVSETERKQLIDLGVDPGMISVVPNPVFLEELDELPEVGTFRRALMNQEPGPEPRIIAYLGRLSPRKRVDLLIDAFARLQATRSPDQRPLVLIIAGSDMGVESGLKEQAVRVGQADSVHFLGVLEGRARLPLLVDADVVVYPCSEEIFGLVPMEALACGTPAVVADDSGCGEWVAEIGGSVFASGDVEALSHAVASALVPDDAARLRTEKAGKRVRELFSPANVSLRLEAVYRAALERAAFPKETKSGDLSARHPVLEGSGRVR